MLFICFPRIPADYSNRSILLEVAPVLFCNVFSMVWEWEQTASMGACPRAREHMCTRACLDPDLAGRAGLKFWYVSPKGCGRAWGGEGLRRPQLMPFRNLIVLSLGKLKSQKVLMISMHLALSFVLRCSKRSSQRSSSPPNCLKNEETKNLMRLDTRYARW